MNIYDIAAKSGVSPATVSRVINGNRHVRAETRAKVLQVIRDTGFQPNAFAQGLNFNSIGMVGVLCSDFADSFYSRAVASLESHLRVGNMNVTVICTGYSVERQIEGIRKLKAKNVDAIVLIGAAYSEIPESYIAEVAQETPVVTVTTAVFDLPNVCAVCCDERGGTKTAIAELLAAGHQNVLFVCEHTGNSNSFKLRGYEDAYEEANIPSPKLVLTTGNSQPEAEAVIYRHLKDHIAEIDAVMAGNDVLAAYVLKAMHRLGCMRPVIGFNNSTLTTMVIPELTSVDNKLEDLCEIAVQRLIDILGQKTVQKKTVLPAELIRRESF
ncbi:MAG: LacI family DNA-binding transcriptional regulator [Clostridia bacterium]|nr:LacI family DNA-binding transcriptional regulator [Clostridia bacterium]